MEAWITVIVAFIVAASTLGANFLQNWQSNKRFKIELGRAIDVDAKKRKWEVKSGPLFKLRDALSLMTTKQDRLVASAHKLHTRFGMTEDEAKEQLQKNADDVNAYLASGDFQQTLFMQDDAELISKVDEIIKDYRSSYIDAMYYKELKATELGKAMEVFEKNKGRIIEVQALINKRLEEL